MSDNTCNRRTFLKGAGLMALAATGAVRVPESHAQEQVPWSSGTGLPKLKAPANSCDCHMHIYDARFPADPGATLRPADALVDDYRLIQKRIGTTRNVVVKTSTYGTDNRVTLDAMAKFGATARGVVVVNASVTDAELKRLADLGVGNPFQPRASRRHHGRDDRTALDASQCSRLARADPHAGRSDRQDRGLAQQASFTDCIRSHGPHSSAGRHRSSRVRSHSQIDRQG